jgi:hypothetical protein
MHLNRILLPGILCLCLTLPCFAQQQEAGDTSLHFSEKFLRAINRQASSLGHKLDKTTDKALARWQRQETKLLRKLAKKDPALAAQLKTDAAAQTIKLQQQLNNPGELQQYLPALDTLKTSLRFLQQKPDLAKLGLKNEQVSGTLDKLKGMEGQLQQAQAVQQFLQQRRQLLKEKLSNLGLAKELKQLNKQAYYYSAQLKEYQSLLKDHKKAAQKGLVMLRKTKAFENFMRRNSQLASLFRLPGDPNDPTQAANLAGLQTRAQVNNLIQNQLAAGGPNAQAQFRQNLQDAQSQLSQLKDKIIKAGGAGGSSSELDMPDGFKPNPEKTKSFWKRVELGTNIQSQRSRGLLPASSDIGLSLGYKLNPNSIIGIGTSYKLGWGKDIRHIKISHQGLSLRSFIDYKLKGSFWLTGGYELNYQSGFSDFNELKDLSRWQPSGLIGVSKVVSLQSKLLKKTKLMLLWDMLSYRQKPRTQAVLFRVGYNF